jgi:predicted small secreted protein
MEKVKSLGLVALAAFVLAACGGNGSSGADVDNSGARGSLIQDPPLRTASLTAADLAANLQANTSGAIRRTTIDFKPSAWVISAGYSF